MNYREMAPLLIAHVRELNFTHVELMPVAEHPFYGSWGCQVTGYFAPTARYGTPDDFAALIDALHQAGIGVILDWVPAHFPDDIHGLARFNGEALYEHPDPQRGHHPDWDTSIFDYGRPEVQSFLIANALYWLEEFHIDGLRVDAVASMLYLDYSRGPGAWTPNIHGGREHLEAVDFIRRFTDTVHREVDGAVVIAEESTAWSGVTAPTQHGGLGFDFKWDLGWMHDTLSYFSEDPVHRRYHHDRITFRAMYQQSEKFMMPLSHDEVVHGKGSILGKMPGDRWQKFANLRLLLGLQWASPGKKLIFMGTEYGIDTEWDHDSSLPWAQTESSHPAGLACFLAEINRLYAHSAPLFAGDHRDDGFQWISGDDRDQSVITFMRMSPGGMHVAVICNFTPVPRPKYQVGVPVGGIWKMMVNSDDRRWGGSGYPTRSQVLAEPPGFHGHAQSLCLDIPPLSVMWFIAEVF